LINENRAGYFSTQIKKLSQGMPSYLFLLMYFRLALFCPFSIPEAIELNSTEDTLEQYVFDRLLEPFDLNFPENSIIHVVRHGTLINPFCDGKCLGAFTLLLNRRKGFRTRIDNVKLFMDEWLGQLAERLRAARLVHNVDVWLKELSWSSLPRPIGILSSASRLGYYLTPLCGWEFYELIPFTNIPNELSYRFVYFLVDWEELLAPRFALEIVVAEPDVSIICPIFPEMKIEDRFFNDPDSFLLAFQQLLH
jgi:hypothetical protein